MASKERLYELWMLYFAKKDLTYLQQWLEAFVMNFEKIIAVQSLDPRRPEDSVSEIPLLPRDVLHVLSQQLAHCVAQIARGEAAEAGLGQALLHVKFFIIICRNLENVQADRTPVFIHEVLSLLVACTAKLKNTPEQCAPGRSQLETVTVYALHLYECLFDPYQTWRRQLSGEIVSMKEKSKYKFAPAALPLEFSTFFQGSFQDEGQLPEALQLRLIHLLGAIISGAKQNALQVITPASVEVLMLVLRRWCSPRNGDTKDPKLLQLTLKTLVGMIHILHASNPGQRKVEIRTILDSYFKVLNSDQPMASLEGSPAARWEEGMIALRVNMLDAIPEMLNCGDRPVLQAMFLSNNCFEHIIRLIQNSKLYVSGARKADETGSELAARLLTESDVQKVLDSSSDAITVHAISVLTSIMSNSPSAKEVFKERIGYSHLYEVLRCQNQPTARLLEELLDMAVEGDHSAFPVRLIRNEQPLLMLIAWLPELKSRDLQVFLSDWLKRVCDASLPSRVTCVKAGMVSCLLDALGSEQELDRKCAENLIYLLQVLGSLSIQPGELRQLIRLLWTEPGKGPHPYTLLVIRALSGMARKDRSERALQYFDLTPSMAGIMVPAIQKWPGSGFAFHAWVCLNEEPEDLPDLPTRLKRKQLYSFFTASGTGFEAFFTADGMLVVAVCTKKEYMTVALPELTFNDSVWHCIDIVHVTGRRPFGQNLVNIYTDGQLQQVAQLRFPSLNESFTSCCIGSAGHRTTTTSTVYPSPSHSPEPVFPSHPSLSRSQSFPASLAPHSWTPGAAQPPREGQVSTMVAGSQDTEWGTPTSLEGHLGSVSIFCEALQQTQVKALFSSGPNVTSPLKPEGDFLELSSKLLLYYTPQACKNNICLDLSPNHFFDGRLTGHKVVNWDIKDVVNCVGGMGVLLPLLEQVADERKEPEDSQETHDLVGPELTSSRNRQGMLIPLGKSSESRLEKNGVAAFLLLVKNFIRHHPVNQESLVQCHGPAIIGALLQKVSSLVMDMNVLMASQILMEQVAAESHSFLLHLLYQYLLFDFRIWSKSDFAVRLGHIQYLSNTIKDHKQRIRKKYGVQYILDSIRTYYGAQKEKPIPTDNVKTVQMSLFSLVKDFLCRSFSADEMQSTLSYLAAVHDEHQVCGVLEVIHSLLKDSASQEQLYAFLFESGNVEVLFSLLVQRKFSDEVRERVFKVLYKMLKYEKAHERSKYRLKLKDVGYQGLISNLNDIPVSMLLFRCLLEQVLGSDSPSYKDLMAVVYLSHRAELAVRLDTCRKQTPEEELCNLLTNIIFSVTWRGVEGWDDAAWKERGQVFSVLTKLGTACELVRPPDEIKRSLLEMMLESAFTDIKESAPATLPSLTQNVLKLLRLLQDFLFSEGHNNQALWSEKIYEGVNSLLDKLGVWYHLANGTSDLKEMAQIGLRVLVGYSGLEEAQLHSLAYVKLHGLLQTASAPREEEACYLLGKLESPLSRALHPKSEAFSWLLPIIRTLLDQCYETLQLQHRLPSLPPTNGSPTFYEDFQLFCTSPEWRAFIEKHVQPMMAQFEIDTFAKSHDHMSNFWNSCYDALMSSSLRREREKEESRKKFQELILEPVMKRSKYEHIRHVNVLKQINNHHGVVLKQWKALRRLLTSQRSAWADRSPPEIRWKLSSAETYSRMRLKLVPNYHFDPHVEASALRDNLGADHSHNLAEPLPLAVAKEAKVSELEDDQLAEEDLEFLDNQAEPKEQSQREKLVISEDCELITIVAVIQGRLEVTTQHVYFYDCSSEKEETEEGIGYDFKRPLSQLREVHLRRYNLRRSALEFFFIDQANYFVNFRKKVRNKVYSSILGLRPPNQIYFGSRSPQELLKASGLTQKWVYREISNFEYLMQLNTIAGRTYNDLSQYPVFPWILQDYVSETLDLSDPGVFRDLSKPIGVANERHAKDVKEKYESFEDSTGMIDKFHYGTHYSNAAGVMHYMIRTEPFTTLHIQLQSGRFDCSDRQFHSVPAAWQARMENPVDVKELIPEFFYFTDFLENQNGFDLGCLQMSNDQVSDVVLPKWARSPEDFVHKHRKALESEHVSAHLHEWIDLIFGYKQRGPAAVEALNVFYYCTYEGAVDLDAIADETQRKALEGIISNFGQTPCQLLKEPHPVRLSAENAARRLARLDTYSPNVFENLNQLKSFFVEGISDGVPLVQAVVPMNQAHSFITQGSPDVLVTVSANGLLGTHGWLPYDKNISNYFSFTKDPTVSNAKAQRFLSGPFAPGVEVSSKTLTISPDGKLLFSGGHWDNSLRVTSLSKGKVVGHITRHIDVVTCLALDLCGIYLISGSRDTTCMVWQVLQQGGFSSGLAPKPVQVLYGHDAEVTCVAISTELDMAVSGSKDGTIIVHTIRRGQFMKSIKPPCESSLPATVSNLAVGLEGQIIVQTTVAGRSSLKDKFALHLYSVNGKHLSSVPLEEQVTALCVTEEFVVLGTMQCSLQILDLQSLQAAVLPMPMKVPVHSVSVTKEKSHILVGLEDGKLIVVGAGQPSEVRTGQFHRRLWRSTRRISQVSSGETEYNPPESK
ncbi:neurobeachin-like protein 2 isoform X7 [Mauremys reevesii]|uniref:neurobeachin-like protein 2 isoform X7 n=1 Tax=Mauremys reevesii TaxID=260615 RepID=UPI00193F03E3|nr:neurobeachin-like protein 2 isoform X7 [Mauremys reevesii]